MNAGRATFPTKSLHSQGISRVTHPSPAPRGTAEAVVQTGPIHRDGAPGRLSVRLVPQERPAS